MSGPQSNPSILLPLLRKGAQALSRAIGVSKDVLLERATEDAELAVQLLAVATAGTKILTSYRSLSASFRAYVNYKKSDCVNIHIMFSNATTPDMLAALATKAVEELPVLRRLREIYKVAGCWAIETVAKALARRDMEEATRALELTREAVGLWEKLETDALRTLTELVPALNPLIRASIVSISAEDGEVVLSAGGAQERVPFTRLILEAVRGGKKYAADLVAIKLASILRSAGYGVVGRLSAVFRVDDGYVEVVVPKSERLPPEEFLEKYGLRDNPEAVWELSRLGAYRVPEVLLERGRIKVVVKELSRYGMTVGISVRGREVDEVTVPNMKELRNHLMKLYTKGYKEMADVLTVSERRIAETIMAAARALGEVILDDSSGLLLVIGECKVRFKESRGINAGAKPSDVVVGLAKGIYVPLSRVPPGMLARRKLRLVIPGKGTIETNLGPVIATIGIPDAVVASDGVLGLVYGDVVVEESCTRK